MSIRDAVSNTSPIDQRGQPILSSSTIQNGGIPGMKGIAAMTNAKDDHAQTLCH
jgi:hypothetical protein